MVRFHHYERYILEKPNQVNFSVGEQTRQASYRGYLNKSFKECGIEKQGRVFHVFRKTFSSKLIDTDVNPAVAMELMRHKNIQTTIDH